jgi:glycosyltransferase involved in cell wall biosynthesis
LIAANLAKLVPAQTFPTNVKINFFCWGDSNDINTWSNVPYFFVRALISRKVDVRRINLFPEQGLILRGLNFFNDKRNGVAARFGLRSREMFRIPAFQRFVNFHVAKTCRKFQDADLNLFLTFSSSSYRYSDVPVALYCDRTYEHHLEERSIRPTYADRCLFRMEKRNIQNARFVFSLNRACLEFIRDRYGVQSPLLLKAAINLSGDDFSDPNALIARKKATRNILFVGRAYYYYQRGVDILLAAFLRFNEKVSEPFTLHLVGITDDQLPKPQAHVICHGYLRKDDPAQYRKYIDLLASARLFVFPMRFGPIAGVLREALWMCTPVILTNVPNAADRVQDGKNGILAAKAEPEEIARCMSVLVANDGLWRRMAAYARESVRDETWEATADRFLQIVGGTGSSESQSFFRHR